MLIKFSPRFVSSSKLNLYLDECMSVYVKIFEQTKAESCSQIVHVEHRKSKLLAL